MKNVILILTDDLGYGDLGCFGNEHVITPNIDKLAKESAKLTRHYSCSPLCAPARAGLLTGKYNHRVGALSVESIRGMDRIFLDEKTMADYFHDAGYRTGMVGKWHNGLYDMRHHPMNRGFDEFYGFLNGTMDYWDWICDRNGSPEYADGRYLTDVFTDEAISFIKNNNDSPFFLYLAYNCPHNPFQALEEDVARFRAKGFNEGVSRLYAMVKRMDHGIGRLRYELKNLKLDEDTIILFTSDNGPWLGMCEGWSMMRYNADFKGMKQDVLEGGIRVPAILHCPGVALPGEYSYSFHFTDWLPTLLALSGVDASNSQWDGINMAPYLDENMPVSRMRYWQHNRYEPVKECNAAASNGKWKLYFPFIPEANVKLQSDNAWNDIMHKVPHFETALIETPVERNLSPPRPPELYDLDNDPKEKNNLSDYHPDLVDTLRHELNSWFEEVNQERLNRKAMEKRPETQITKQNIGKAT